MDSNNMLTAQHSAYIDKSAMDPKQEDIRRVMKSRGGTRKKINDDKKKIEKPEVPKFANLQLFKMQKAPR